MALTPLPCAKKFGRGETVEVVATMDQPGAGPHTLRVRRTTGEEVLLKVGAGSACFDVGQARELKVAAGDWLLFQANQGTEFVNGERVQVREIQNGRIALADGRVLPKTFNTFTHGYALTSHSAQGKTVDEVLLVASSKSFAAVNREQFYVSISRGRERVHVFTDDADLLARRVTAGGERQAAVELVAWRQQLRDELAQLGFLPRQPLKPEAPTTPTSTVAAHQDFRAVRPLRAMRATRLAPVQRLLQVAEEVRRWIAQKFGRAETPVLTDILAINLGWI
ncbi:MAG TPA: ATP-binding domain-containing protein [Candidatus Paceibacterota bacterium]|nr:ATP-binding domain-containing protein [Candidatus Paceibacterota bacterium]